MKSILIAEGDRALRLARRKLLVASKLSVTVAKDGVEALGQLQGGKFDLVLLDLGLPRLGGLELLSRLRTQAQRPKVVIMTSDDTPETLLRAVREQAYEFVNKPFPPRAMAELVEKALADTTEAGPIEVLSARPDWVELLVPCQLEAAKRIQGFLMRLKADLPEGVRESVGQAFRELLLNAIEYGGKLDPNRKVRIAYLRGRRMLMYRIADPGSGFRREELNHAAVNNPPGSRWNTCTYERRKACAPAGLASSWCRGWWMSCCIMRPGTKSCS